jgi:hypothetical protein
VARLCDPHDEDYTWVNVINPTDEPVTIERGEVMAHHAETDLLNMTITKVDTGTMITDDNGVSLSQEIRNMTVQEVDDTITKISHLHDLDLTGSGGLMSVNRTIDSPKPCRVVTPQVVGHKPEVYTRRRNSV